MPSEQQTKISLREWQIQDNACLLGKIFASRCAMFPNIKSMAGGRGTVSGRRRGRRRLYRGICWIDPARQNAAIQRVGDLGIDVVSVLDEAAESRLNVGARAAETVVEIKVAEGGVEVVAPQQADHPPSKPNAFGIAGRPAQGFLRFGILVDLLVLFGRLLACRRGLVGGVASLFSAAKPPARKSRGPQTKRPPRRLCGQR